ncbi:uncharacterized protein N7487_009682 [Penicillium crustosum]|uniref:uncharacterized protein n=1 Tax=Penicillium crustosum TaxID=36656 RepID=UPI0023A46A0A|nr:uncharacterized protein N7487_009682 [Penicillium crustosum]KAJ5395379.1 hypothetical protein N7487_009682 [Penicillium crustosum]
MIRFFPSLFLHLYSLRLSDSSRSLSLPLYLSTLIFYLGLFHPFGDCNIARLNLLSIRPHGHRAHFLNLFPSH